MSMLDYAPYEERNTALMVPKRLKFPHAWTGHRYVGFGGGIAGAAGGAAAGGAASAGGAAAAAGSLSAGAYGAALATSAAQSAAAAASSTAASTASATSESGLATGGQAGGASQGGGFGGVVGFVRQPLVIPSRTSGNQVVVIGQQASDRGGPLTIGQAGGGGFKPGGQPVPVLDTTKPCGACGEIRHQIEDVQQSIKLERQQQTAQKLEQSRELIDEIKTRERVGDTTNIDQQIQQKLDLLDSLNLQLAQQENDAREEVFSHPENLLQPQQNPLPPAPTLGQITKQNLLKYLDEAKGTVTCVATLTKLGIPSPLAMAVCAGYQQVKGDAREVEHFVTGLHDMIFGHGAAQPPPQPAKPMEFCVTCESAEDALKYQSGEGTTGCYLVNGSVKHGA
jgi:hypothetical protein